MNNKIASILIVVLTLLMFVATVLVISEYSITNDEQLLFISIVFSLITVLMLLFILFDVVIGRKLYIFRKDKIIVSRKGKTIVEISNKDIILPVLVKNTIIGKNQMLTFNHNGKKHILLIRQDNEIALKQFTSGISVKTKDNTAEYVLLYILEIFCV